MIWEEVDPSGAGVAATRLTHGRNTDPRHWP